MTVRPLSVDGRLVGALLACALCGCEPIVGPVVVEALIPDANERGGVAFGDVTLERVLDLRTGRGQDFDVRGNLKVSVARFSDLSGDLDDMVDRTRGAGGQDVDPHMSNDGDRFIADDFETLFYFTVSANFEAAFAAARGMGDTSRATSDDDDERAVVALFGSLVLADLFPVPIISSDNAAFAPPADGWLALRSALQDGVPFAMHRGVIAHEFGHRLFFHNVVTAVPGGFEVWRADATRESLDEGQLRAQMLLKGLDEGLADVFAMAALEDKDAINDAFAGAGALFAEEAPRRDVEGPFASVATYDGLRTLSIDADLLQSCGLTRAEFSVSFNFYCVGTVVAAALWEAAERDPTALRAEIMPAVLAGLAGTGARLANGEVFDLDVFLEPFAAATAPGARRDAVCAAFATRFESLVSASRVPSCL